MVYTQMLFALGFDKVIFGTTPAPLSIIGSSLILGSAIYVAVHKDEAKPLVAANGNSVYASNGEEELGLVTGFEMDERDNSDNEMD
jgi:hypothetical protein